MHEYMESRTYEEDGEERTYASPTAEGNPWKGRGIAGFRGKDQVKRAEEWMHHWSEASGDKQRRKSLMQQADLPMAPEKLEAYLTWSTSKSGVKTRQTPRLYKDLGLGKSRYLRYRRGKEER